VKARCQRKVSPFIDNRYWEDRSLGAVTVCERLQPAPWSLLNLARCAGDRRTGQKLPPVHSENSVPARQLVGEGVLLASTSSPITTSRTNGLVVT
jgi:hypothetical protein